jgi:hypothetical protein
MSRLIRSMAPFLLLVPFPAGAQTSRALPSSNTPSTVKEPVTVHSSEKSTGKIQSMQKLTPDKVEAGGENIRRAKKN